jgi:hypothetical protein
VLRELNDCSLILTDCLISHRLKKYYHNDKYIYFLKRCPNLHKMALSSVCTTPRLEEIPPRPSTMAENHKRPQLTQSSSNIVTSVRTQNTIKIEPNGEEQLFRGVTGRVSLGEVSKPEYLHIRLSILSTI